MSLMVSDGSEMIRYNPSTASIEASNSRGISWSMRYRCSNSEGDIRKKNEGEIQYNLRQNVMFVKHNV